MAKELQEILLQKTQKDVRHLNRVLLEMYNKLKDVDIDYLNTMMESVINKTISDNPDSFNETERATSDTLTAIIQTGVDIFDLLKKLAKTITETLPKLDVDIASLISGSEDMPSDLPPDIARVIEMIKKAHGDDVEVKVMKIGGPSDSEEPAPQVVPKGTLLN